MATKALISFGVELSGSVGRGMLVGQEDGYSNQASGRSLLSHQISQTSSRASVFIYVWFLKPILY